MKRTAAPAGSRCGDRVVLRGDLLVCVLDHGHDGDHSDLTDDEDATAEILATSGYEVGVPTAWAYEAATKALWKHRRRVDDLVGALKDAIGDGGRPGDECHPDYAYVEIERIRRIIESSEEDQ